jgi:hypothetical protein
MVFKLKELVNRVDEQLHTHFDTQGLQFIQFAFRWMNCLLMRELRLSLIIRLWDTYLSEDGGDGFKVFHIYACAAFLIGNAPRMLYARPAAMITTRTQKHTQARKHTFAGFAERLKEMEFQDLVLFLQSLPTGEWEVKDVESLLSQAFIYQSLFESSPSHLQ